VTPPLFRVADGLAAGARLTLSGAEGRHAADVMRLRVGEPILLTNAAGSLGNGSIAEVRRGELDVVVEQVDELPAPSPRLVVVQALAKGGRDEDAIEAMTEVGVDHIVGWSAARSIAKWTDRTATKWQSTVTAAAKQSRRGWWPLVTGPETSADVAHRLSTAALAVVLHESASESLAAIDIPADGEVVVVVGPEGGITEDELLAFGAVGGRVVRLGDTVLRSSTAGVAALAVVSARCRWR